MATSSHPSTQHLTILSQWIDVVLRNGISFNGGLGFIYTLNSSLEIDIGYNVKTFVWETFTDRYDAGEVLPG